MAEPKAYPGSPSVAAEVREKVLQTFRHTLDMARGGKVEEALLGCDFILKMDVRFAPARRLLDALRGVAAGTVIDLSEFGEFAAPARPAAAAALPSPTRATAASAPQPRPAPAPAPAPAPRPTPVAAPPPPAPAPAFASADPFFDDNPFAAPPAAPAAPAPAPFIAGPTFDLPPLGTPGPASAQAAQPPRTFDDLGFDDFAQGNPFLTQPQAPAPAQPPLAVPPPSFPSFDAPSGGDLFASGADLFTPAPASPGASAPLQAPPSFEDAGPALGGPGGPASLVDLGFDAPPDFAAPVPVEASREPAPAATAAAIDPRITQFLKQGDEAFSRGHLQEAIDLWSRVFLIDLNNEEASRRIDAAREKQQAEAQKLEMLLADGVSLYEAGDLAGARSRFLEVLAISDGDVTARNYLNQIDAALAPSPEASAAAGTPASSSDYLGDELESPMTPSFAADLPGLGGAEHELTGLAEPESAVKPQGPGPRPKGGGVKIDLRLLIAAAAVVLAAVGGGAYFLFRGKPAPPPVEPAQTRAATTAPGAAAEDPIARARTLFSQGKGEEALRILAAVPASDPNHDSALALIDQYKSTAEPGAAAPPPPSAADLDALRTAGLSALKGGRSIEAVKALDPVARARPDDTEAAQALAQAREQVSELGNAIKRYNEQDYESAQRILWEIKKKSPKNQDVEEYLFKSYFNDGVLNLQAGSMKKAVQAFQEAASLRPQDAETRRHLKFAQKYVGGTDDLLSRIYVRYVAPRP